MIHSALALFAQRTRIPTSARSIGFCVIWVCISSSSSSSFHRILPLLLDLAHILLVSNRPSWRIAFICSADYKNKRNSIENMNFPALALARRRIRICVVLNSQVTSQVTGGGIHSIIRPDVATYTILDYRYTPRRPKWSGGANNWAMRPMKWFGVDVLSPNTRNGLRFTANKIKSLRRQWWYENKLIARQLRWMKCAKYTRR